MAFRCGQKSENISFYILISPDHTFNMFALHNIAVTLHNIAVAPHNCAVKTERLCMSGVYIYQEGIFDFFCGEDWHESEEESDYMDDFLITLQKSPETYSSLTVNDVVGF